MRLIAGAILMVAAAMWAAGEDLDELRVVMLFGTGILSLGFLVWGAARDGKERAS